MSTQEVRDALVSSIQRMGARLVEIRRLNARPKKDRVLINVVEGGGLSLVEDCDQFRLGPVWCASTNVVNPGVIARWNRIHLQHQVQLVDAEKALEFECSRLAILLATLENPPGMVQLASRICSVLTGPGWRSVVVDQDKVMAVLRRLGAEHYRALADMNLEELSSFLGKVLRASRAQADSDLSNAFLVCWLER